MAVPPHIWFGVSAVFHYLGPAFAVLLFAHVAPLGVAWLRIASAAIIFALEPVFAAILAAWLLGDHLGARGAAGGALVLAGIVVSEMRLSRAAPP